MFNPINNKAYVKLTRSILITELKRLETEAVSFIIIVGIKYHVHSSFHGFDNIALATAAEPAHHRNTLPHTGQWKA